MNEYQSKVINSWVAYRDNSLFSFKVATTKVDRPPLLTSSGGSILEGHDFTQIDLEQPYQNKFSDYAKFASSIISRRLASVEIDKPPDQFFPTNPTFKRALTRCNQFVRDEFVEKNPGATQKQITDYVYKYGRAYYFRSRHAKSNLPPYSGFETLVHLSTGVVRNLLEPCFWMYDSVISQLSALPKEDRFVKEIPWQIQNRIIQDKSKRMWEFISEGLDKYIEGCSREQAKQIYNLFNQLAILFDKRLMTHRF